MTHKIFRMDNIPEKLINNGEKKYFKKNEIIFNPGDIPDYICVLVKGSLIEITNSYKGSLFYDFLILPPCTIGHAHALSKKEMTATFKCLEDVEVIKISIDTLANIIKSDVEVTTFLHNVTFKLFEYYSFQTRAYATLSSQEIIEKTLIEFSEIFGKEIDGKIKINYNLNHQFISNLVGVTRLTTMHALRKLEKKNIITISDGVYYINDLSAISNIKII